MLLTRLFAYLEAKSAAGLLSVSDFIEAKLKQFTKRVITKHHEIVVKNDGTTDIVNLDKGSDEEALDYALRDQDVAGKHAKLDTELASLDQRIREEEDKLSEIKEKREASGITNEPPGPIKSELRKSFICLLFFLLVEIATLTIFFQDVFAGNLILLLVLASGTCGGTYLLGF